jgi:lipoprotein-anchoring transpeptidase ErfK/SrfK
MVGARRLAKVYLAAASSFAVAIVLSQHPALYHASKVTAHFIGARGVDAAVALNNRVLTPSWHAFQTRIAEEMRPAPNAMRMAQAPSRAAAPVAARVAEITPPHVEMPVHITPPTLRPPIVDYAPQVADQSAPSTAAEPEPQTADQAQRTQSRPVELANNIPAAPKMSLAPEVSQVPAQKPALPPSVANTPPPDIAPPSQVELTRVAQHVKDSLTSDMLANFDLFLFVSKAATAPVGQRMYVFQKQSGDDLALLYNWPVSTGREKFEIAPNGTNAPSFTPAGYYELDPKRMYTHHFSGQWHQPMPHAMFFNWMDHGYQTGLAIHGAAPEDIKFLGSRSSAGCIHLSPQNASLLYNLIRTQFKGDVPKFAFDKHTATMANDGVLMHDAHGNLQMAQGYKVLVYVENYGGENVVAALF